MDDELCFVQFLHPGGEHEPDRGLIKNWNKNDHRRKFLKGRGLYLADAKPQKSKIVFWGEWEPESRAQRKIPAPILQGPHYIYEPYYVAPKSYEGLQNTDPFVFGDDFYYTGCQQRTKKGPTQLRYLSKGSVILFGSCISGEFALDTVFVVDGWLEHTQSDYRRVLADASKEYKDVTIYPWYQSAPVAPLETWRLYHGVRHSKPLQGMYSFFPCQPYEPESRGFSRPRIHLPEITDNLNQGKRLNKQRNLDKIALLWDNVAKQVKDQGLALGVYAEMPLCCTDG
jgi:hypothetical protein